MSCTKDILLRMSLIPVISNFEKARIVITEMNFNSICKR